MNKNLILKTDVLDIIFEKRNKLYGAYDLRKFYPNRLKLALGLMFLTAIAFSAFTFLPEANSAILAKPYDMDEPRLKELKDKPKEPKAKKEVAKSEAKPAEKQKPVNQKAFTNNPIIVDDKQKTDTIVTLRPEDNFGITTIVTPSSGPVLVTPKEIVPGDGGTGKPAVTIDKTLPLEGDAVDVLPSYPGGMDAFRKFLERNLQTPGDLEEGQTVSVRIKFVVDYNGKLKSFSTVLDGGEAYNKEVVRVLKKMPDWIPGKAKGENVSVYHIIPVKFVPAD